MADTFSKPSNQQQKLKWARIWFDKLVGFHGIARRDAERWDFSADQVIAYLRWGRDCCLLYTSPSPRDRTRSRMPSSA